MDGPQPFSINIRVVGLKRVDHSVFSFAKKVFFYKEECERN